MSNIKVEGKKYREARTDKVVETFSQAYVDETGLTRRERHNLSAMADFHHAATVRYSQDNGKTWGEWEDVYSNNHDVLGEHDRTRARRPLPRTGT